jgi:streptogramin lyase
VSTARGYVARVDPASNTVVKTIKVPAKSSGAIVAGAGAIWLAESSPDSLLRIDAATGRVRRVPITDGNGRTLAPSVLAIAHDAVFVGGTWAREGTLTNDHAVARIDAATVSVDETTPVREPPSAVLTDGESVWLVSPSGETISRLNTTGQLTTRVALPHEGILAGIRSAAVWVVYPDGTLRGIPIRELATVA